MSVYIKMDIEVFYKFRFTFQGQSENHDYDTKDLEFQYTTDWFIEQLESYHLGKLTSGIEFLNSKGQPTWAHVHIHFSSKSKKDTIMKQLKRKWKEDFDEQFPNGNKNYCLSIETYVNEEKFWRYPLKQRLDLDWRNKKRQLGFTIPEFELMHEKANDCWKIGCEVNNAKQEKKDESDSLYDRLLDYYNKDPKKEEIEILAKLFEFVI